MKNYEEWKYFATGEIVKLRFHARWIHGAAAQREVPGRLVSLTALA